MYVTHRVPGLGSLFLVTGKEGVLHPQVFAHLGTHPLAQTIADTGLSKAGRRPFHLYPRPLFPKAFRPISPNLAQVCFLGILSTHSPLDFTRVHVSPRDSAPPRSTYQRLLPAVWSLITPAFPAIAIHSGSLHQLRTLSSISAPSPAATEVTIPIAKEWRGYGRLGGF